MLDKYHAVYMGEEQRPTWVRQDYKSGPTRAKSCHQSQETCYLRCFECTSSLALGTSIELAQDSTMACLLVTQDVVLLFNNAHSRITFPSPTRPPSDFLAYRPPQAAQVITTAHIFCNENMFATISSAGEIFTFNVPTPPAPGERPAPVQPQRVWALRKQWSAVHVRQPFRISLKG
jgi:hypothetical protein